MSLREEYLQKVAGQIRVKRVREPLINELRAHMLDGEQALEAQGTPPEEAQKRTVSDMGDALLVGGELDRVHRPKVCWAGLAAATGLTVLGIVLQAALSSTGFDAVGGIRLWAAVATMGIIALLGLTDYTWWTRLALPVCAVWLVIWLYRIAGATSFYSPLNRFWHSMGGVPQQTLSYVPQMLAVAAPALAALTACRLRGKGWGAFIICVSFCLLAFKLAFDYKNSGFDANAMGLCVLICPACLALAVKKEFFAVNRKAAYAVLAVICVWPLWTFLRRFINEISYRQPRLDEYVYPILRAAKAFGRGAFPVTPREAMINPAKPDMLIYAVYRVGFVPVLFFLAGAASLLAYTLRRFAHMENRMGSLIGLTAAATLTLQCALYVLAALTNYTCSLCLPLVSYGNAMMLLDAVLVGLILSCLRGEALPESVITRIAREV